jgi:hypothetical protein
LGVAPLNFSFLNFNTHNGILLEITMESIIKFTNRIALFSIGLLIYWVFIYIAITVFGLKVFRENITQAFYLSILGIFALLFAAIIVNVMFNLTKISNSLSAYVTNSEIINSESKSRQKWNRRAFIYFLLSFPIIFVLLFLGDFGTSRIRKSVLVSAAKSLVKENQNILSELTKYSFSKEYIEMAKQKLTVITKLDENLSQIQLIVGDQFDGKSVFLQFSSYGRYDSDVKIINKSDYIYSCSASERSYLTNVFAGSENDYLFSANDGNYELYYPVIINAKTVVLYFTDRQNYGKYGS